MLNEHDAEKFFEVARTYNLLYPRLTKIGRRPNPHARDVRGHVVVGVPEILPKGWILEWPGQSIHISATTCAIYRSGYGPRFFGTVYYKDVGNTLTFIYNTIGGDFTLAPGNQLLGIHINFMTQSGKLYSMDYNTARQLGLTW